MNAPLAVEPAPQFSWQLSADRRGVTQRAYQLQVATSVNALADPDVFDSGRVESDDSLDIRYSGPDLAPDTDYLWRVRVWDDTDAVSDWSEPATFATARGAQPWAAEWIGAAGNPIGAEWTDYTIEFTASDIAAALGVYLRGADTENAYMWQFSEVSNELRPHIKQNSGYTVLSPAALPAGFDFAAEHDYAITVAGSSITTSIDGTVIDERTDTTFPGPGIVGFRTSGDESGLIHDVTVTTADGQKLVDTDFPAGDRTFASGTVTDGGLLVNSAGAEAWFRRDNPIPLLRKEFDSDKQVARARIHASARGVYQLRLNGEKVGAEELAPGWTAYDKRIDYQTYDVTEQIRSGANVLGAEVAPGWYTGKVAMFGTDVYGTDTSVLAELTVDYTDGSSTVIGTDGTWLTTPGPIREADLLDGEDVDAVVAAEVDGWDEPGFDSATWEPATVRADEPTDVLEAQTAEPVRVTEELDTARRIDSPTPGVYLYDLGQNMVGHVRLTVRGEDGNTIRLRHGEVLNPDGTLYTANLRSAKATDYYTVAGDAEQTFEPKFTFHGFRYVEISGVDNPPDAADLVGVVVGTDGELTAELDTNSDMVNQLQRNIVWGMRGNFLSIPTDTPARDERMGWTGDINVFARTAVYNMDARTFLAKWMQDLRDTQRADGALPGVAPVVPGRFDGGYGPAGWMDAGVHVPWTLWQAYGDTAIIDENYDMMRRYVDYLLADSTDYIRSTGGYLDWLNLDDNTPADVLDTAFVAKSTRELAQMAAATGRDAEAAELQERYEAIRAAYQNAFIADDGSVRGDSQTSYILTLTNDLVPDDLREALIDQFVETLERRDFHLSTGFLGVDGLLPALTEAGRSDIAYRLLLNEDYPSWGYEINLGATTVWERWNSINPDGSFNDVGMNSFNHYAYGAVGEWMYRTMAGVSAAEPGYSKVLIAPHPGDGITRSDFTLQSRHGTIRSSWNIQDGPMTLDVTVPANTTAEVRIPAPNRWSVTEGDAPIGDVDGIEYLGTEDADGADGGSVVVLEIGSGSYSFAVDTVFGNLGAAQQTATAIAAAIDDLEVTGAQAKAAKRQLQARAEALVTELESAWDLYRRDTDDRVTAGAVHRALATTADLDRRLGDHAEAGLIDADAATALQKQVAIVDGQLSAASAELVGLVARLGLPAGEVLPGDEVPVTVTVTNAGQRPLTGVDSALTAPDGWTVVAAGEHPATVPGRGEVRHEYLVTVPDDAEPTVAELTGTLTYRSTGGGGGAATLPLSATVPVAPGVIIDALTTPGEPVGPGADAAVAIELTNRTGVTQDGQVTLTLPDGWAAADPVDYHLEPGQQATVDTVVTVPLTVAAGPASVTAATGDTDAEKKTAAVTVTVDTPPAGAIDHVDLGDTASETAHGLTASEHSGTNVEAGLTRRYTHSSFPGGWFAFDVEVPTSGRYAVLAIETFDGAFRKTYQVTADDQPVFDQNLARSESGQGTIAYQFVVDDPDSAADGTVRLQFTDTDADYDPSIADVWIVPLD